MTRQTDDDVLEAEAAACVPRLDEPLVDAPEYLISFLQRLNRDQMESVLRRSGLKLTSWRILSCLDERGPMSLLDLAELSVIERTVTSRLVDKLSADDLVRKEAFSHDKRVSMVAITARGRALLKSADMGVRRLRLQLFRDFSEEEYRTLCGLLRRLSANAQSIRW
ncbi:MarR family transcriptional regulator [Aquibium sp. A9E412]|uniref:MarR family winged helix-turn-helix transcriptional regulator n=1 Tax=Aquibium sp. A9E412 TaxID=2976767 RepID=UPI0025B0BC6F|nr:MarR family transcriptional regulator [Aquibium sp. A9E412]MDN2565609.1 MarR family transcriptional regulator [Aquibium sp. A9E412]